MNAYAILILVALVAEYLLNLAADLVNLKALAPELPRELSDVYDVERYRKSQEYTRVRTRFGLISATFHFVVLLAFWFAGGFPWLDGMVRGLALSPIVTGILFIGCLGIGGALLSVPFRWVSTFVIEERFGFNKTTPKVFLFDAIKGLLLTVALGGPLLAAVLWFFQAAGSLAWVWCWVATATFVVFVQFIAPAWIFPLFNKFEPLEDGELRERILRYAQKVAFPVNDIFVIDGSRRTTKANAFFTGVGRRKRVALFDTLVKTHAPEEIVAIVAHEIGHYKKAHILEGLVISIVHWGIVFFLLSIFLKSGGLFEAFYVQEKSVYAGLVFFGILLSPIDLLPSLFVQALSRKNEFEADAYARKTASGAALVDGLKRLSAESLSNLTPHPLYVKLNYSHPPLIERIAALSTGA